MKKLFGWGNWKRRAGSFLLFKTSRAAIDRPILVPRTLDFAIFVSMVLRMTKLGSPRATIRGETV
jgi:hypothetical protein